jgi:hypothetical protein
MSLDGGGSLRRRPAREDSGDESEALRLVPPASRILAGLPSAGRWVLAVGREGGGRGEKGCGSFQKLWLGLG